MPNALYLSLPGAASSPYIVDGVPGIFHPQIPVAVGEGHPISDAYAEKLHADEGTPLRLGEASDTELAAGAELADSVAEALKGAPRTTKVDRARAAEQKAAADAAGQA